MVIHDINPLGASTRTWLLVDDPTRQALIVDPVHQHLIHYVDYLGRNGLELAAIVDTHTHADHVSGASELSIRLGVPLVMHHQAPRACVNRRVHHGDEIDVGSLTLRVLTTPGHTYDSLSLAVEDVLVTGDLMNLGPRGHGDEVCADVGAFADSLRMLESLSAVTRVFGTHDAPGARPEPLLTALARAGALNQSADPEVAASRMGTGFVAPTDGATFDFLRANSSCDSTGADSASHPSQQRAAFERKSPSELAAALQSTVPPHVVDVRSPAEYYDDGLGSIPGSLLVPLEHLEAEADNLRALGTPIVVSCRSMVRSVLGAGVLETLGLRSVSVLEGGILAWASEGYPVQSNP
jgi:glyoxylase-like metal-dependent hydrolase (beta-lactamase superfamily II)/rhodanese-related sulfurtransferase